MRTLGRSRALLLTLFLAAGLATGAFLSHRGLPAWALPDACVAGDINGDRVVDVSDAISLLEHLFLGGKPPATCVAPQDTTRHVIVVRHAERDTGADPPLNEAGQARAELLAKTLQHTDVHRLIASDLLRTQQTLQPTADAKNLEIVEIPTDGVPSEMVASDVASSIGELEDGQLAVVAHHSFTIPEILRELGIPGETVSSIRLSGSNYDNLLVLRLSDTEPPELLRLSYGE